MRFLKVSAGFFLAFAVLLSPAFAQLTQADLQDMFDAIGKYFPDDAIHVQIALSSGGTQDFTVLTSGGKVTTINGVKPSSPTIRIETSQATLAGIAKSGDPTKATIDALNNGGIRIVYLNTINQIKGFFFGIFTKLFSLFVGGVPATTQPATAAATALCPNRCFLNSLGGGPAGVINVNCEVATQNVYKALNTCAGKESYTGGEQKACSCQSVEVVDQACPASCTSGQSTCQIDTGAVGKSGIPCDGTFQGTVNMACKCVFKEDKWDVGSRYNIR